jgi:hypothetical protein
LHSSSSFITLTRPDHLSQQVDKFPELPPRRLPALGAHSIRTRQAFAISCHSVRCHWHNRNRLTGIFSTRSHLSRVGDRVARRSLRSNCSWQRNVPAESHSRSLIDDRHENSYGISRKQARSNAQWRVPPDSPAS